MKHLILGAFVVYVAVAASAAAQETSIAGTWTLNVDHVGVRLVLEQKGAEVTGKLDWPHGDPITLTGAYTGDRLMFFGESGGENFAIHISATGVRQADGSLSGTLNAHFDEFNDAHQIAEVQNQEIHWTAVRGLQKNMHPGAGRE
jgi:hypothetical protein